MNSSIILVIGLAAVFGVLLFGVASMLKGGEFNRKYANRMMRLRVLLQLMVILFLGIILWWGN